MAHESPSGRTRSRAAVASRSAATMSPSMSDPYAASSRPPAVRQARPRAVGDVPGRSGVDEHQVGATLLDGQERAVPVEVGAEDGDRRSCATSVSAASRSAWARPTSPAEASSQPASEQRLGPQARRHVVAQGDCGRGPHRRCRRRGRPRSSRGRRRSGRPSAGSWVAAQARAASTFGPLGPREGEAGGLLAGRGRGRRTRRPGRAYHSACARGRRPRPARPRSGARRRRRGCCRAAGTAPRRLTRRRR